MPAGQGFVYAVHIVQDDLNYWGKPSQLGK